MHALVPSVVLALVMFTQPPGESDVVELISQVSGKTYITRVSDVAIRKTPRWDDDSDSPPVPPRKALKLAEKMKKSLVDNPDELRLMQLTLTPHAGGWFWLVVYSAPPDLLRRAEPDEPPELPSLDLVVLMDGTVIEPIVEQALPEKEPAN
jgi:hypothetical protein